MLRCKPSVRFESFTPAMMVMVNTLYACDRGKLEGQPDDLVITSANDSTHGAQSRHYRNEALDLRSKTFAAEAKEPFRKHLEKQLGPKFRVLFEGKGTANEHFHIQVRKGLTFP